jgi:Rrf2 family protein
MISIARLSEDDSPVSLEQVSNATGVSRRYLEQLAMPLKSHGLLRSVSGRRGGYLLARSAEKIRLREIVEAAIGPISVVDCVDDPRLCEKADSCENRLIYLLINQRICEVLEEYSLADLADYARLARLCSELTGQPPKPGQAPSAEGVTALCTRILEDKVSRAGP